GATGATAARAGASAALAAGLRGRLRLGLVLLRRDGSSLDLRGALADQLVDDGGRDVLHRDRDLRLAQDVLHIATLLGQHERDDGARSTGTSGATRAVQVRLVLDGRVD